MDILLLQYISSNRKNSDKGILREGFSASSVVGIPGYFASFLVSLFTGYLSWKQNENASLSLRIFYTLIAFTFSGIYLIYYFLKKYTSGNHDLDPLNHGAEPFWQ